MNYRRPGQAGSLSGPTAEHCLPVLYVLGLRDPGENARLFAGGNSYCSLSMRPIRIG